jgi:hypothetical protein
LFGSVSSEQRRPIVVPEGERDSLAAVLEVQHEAVMFLWVRTIQARKSLDCLNARQRLIDVHRVQQRLIVASLELVRADQEAIGVILDFVGDIGAGEAVKRCL